MDAGQDLVAEEFDFGHHVLVVETGLLEGQVDDTDAALFVVGAELLDHGVGAADEVELGSRDAAGRRLPHPGMPGLATPRRAALSVQRPATDPAFQPAAASRGQFADG